MIYNYFLDFIKSGKGNNTELLKKYRSGKNIYLILSIVSFLVFVTLAYNLDKLYLTGLVISFIFANLSMNYKRRLLKKTAMLEWSDLSKSEKESKLLQNSQFLSDLLLHN